MKITFSKFLLWVGLACLPTFAMAQNLGVRFELLTDKTHCVLG